MYYGVIHTVAYLCYGALLIMECICHCMIEGLFGIIEHFILRIFTQIMM